MRIDRWIVAAVLAAGIAGGTDSVFAQGREDAGKDKKRAEIVAKLDSLKVSLDFEKTPLEEVIDFIRTLSEINIIIDKKVRDVHGDDPLEVSLKLNEVSLRTALKLTLGMHDLTAKYRDGVLIILPKDDASDEDLVTRIYDVRDLLMPITDFPGPNIELTNGDDGQTGAEGFGSPAEQPGIQPEFIVEMVQKNTGGGSWEKNPKCSVSLNNGLLVVVQSPEVHKEVLNLIRMLRVHK